MSRATGKVLGGLLGLVLGSWAGGLLGFVLGHLHDVKAELADRRDRMADARAQNNGFSDSFQQSTYTIGIIVLGAKMAKTDGRVSRAEIEAFRRVFHISDERLNEVGTLFDQARMSASGYEPYAARLAQVFRYRPGVLEEILTGLFYIALADSAALSRDEDLFLRRVASLFGFTELDFLRIAARAGVKLADHPKEANPEAEALAVLNLAPQATAIEIKKSYRALIRKHHPDKLVAQGLPSELIAQATEKMKRINAAYATVCKARGIK